MLNREEMMKEMISKVDQVALEDYVSETDRSATYNADLTKHLKRWAENKVDIYIKFGRKLKLETEIECAISDSERVGLRDEVLRDYSSPVYMLANTFVRTINTEEAAENYLNKDYYMFGARFAKGMRVSRCFKQLLPSKLVDDYQTKFSMFIQKFKIIGKAVVSIDPIDYLTMSVNNSGWKSCHIISTGCYKAGCISYMTDASTAISYTTDKEITANRKHEGLKYDNKLWRQCVHVGEDFAIQARQYPNVNHSNRVAVANMLVQAMNESFGVDNFEQDSRTCDELYDFQYNEGGDAYNDIYEGAFDQGGGLISSSTKSNLKNEISINRSALCVHCGEDWVDESGYLLCCDCYGDHCDDDYDDDDF